MNEKEKQTLKQQITELCLINGTDEQLIDLDHEIDSELTYSENLRIIKEAYNLKEASQNLKDWKELSSQQRFEKWNNIHQNGFNLFKNYQPFCVAIVGNRRSGKTATGHSIVDCLRSIYHLPVYLFKYPREDLLNKIGYRNLKEIGSIEYLQDAIVYLDEPQLSLPKYEKRNNDILENIISICAHRNIILVISTSDTRWINKKLESYIDVYIIKDLDYGMIKRGSKIKQIIANNSNLSPESFKLRVEEYLLYYKNNEDFQGKFESSLPSYWNDEYSKPYRIATRNATIPNPVMDCEQKREVKNEQVLQATDIQKTVQS